MLVALRVENFRSFSEVQELSMVASADKIRADTLVKCGKLKLLRSAAVFGTNAAGKSNLFKALFFLKDFVVNSATTMTQGDRINAAIPFRLDQKLESKPCRFQIAVVLGETRYEYTVAITPERVHSESLYVPQAKGRPLKLFTREFDPKHNRTKWEFPKLKSREASLLKARTRDNGLVLSRASELNIRIADDLFLWFKNSLWTFDLADRPLILTQQTANQVRQDASAKNRVLELMKNADFAIDNIRPEPKPSITLPAGLPEQVRKVISDAASLGPPILDVRTLHHRADGTPVEFSLLDDESNGTQRFFSVCGPFLIALDIGATVVIDEFECSMHPRLTRKIVEMFNSPEANPRGAQLLFVTHDTSLMNPSLLRRDQIWITDKSPDGHTKLSSLYDFIGKAVRNKEAFERNYLSGQYGGIPFFGPLYEDHKKP